MTFLSTSTAVIKAKFYFFNCQNRGIFMSGWSAGWDALSRVQILTVGKSLIRRHRSRVRVSMTVSHLLCPYVPSHYAKRCVRLDCKSIALTRFSQRRSLVLMVMVSVSFAVHQTDRNFELIMCPKLFLIWRQGFTAVAQPLWGPSRKGSWPRTMTHHLCLQRWASLFSVLEVWASSAVPSPFLFREPRSNRAFTRTKQASLPHLQLPMHITTKVISCKSLRMNKVITTVQLRTFLWEGRKVICTCNCPWVLQNGTT